MPSDLFNGAKLYYEQAPDNWEPVHKDQHLDYIIKYHNIALLIELPWLKPKNESAEDILEHILDSGMNVDEIRKTIRAHLDNKKKK